MKMASHDAEATGYVVTVWQITNAVKLKYDHGTTTIGIPGTEIVNC